MCLTKFIFSTKQMFLLNIFCFLCLRDKLLRVALEGSPFRRASKVEVVGRSI